MSRTYRDREARKAAAKRRNARKHRRDWLFGIARLDGMDGLGLTSSVANRRVKAAVKAANRQ